MIAAMRRWQRWPMLGIAWIVLSAIYLVLFVLGMSLIMWDWPGWSGMRQSPAAWLLLVAMGLSASQVLFLLPIFPRARAGRAGAPLRRSIVVAGGIAGLLTCGLLMALASAVTLLVSGADDEWGTPVTAFIVLPGEVQEVSVDWGILVPLGIGMAVLAVSWIAWIAVLRAFAQRRNRDSAWLPRLTALLFAGTAIEVVLTVPIDVLVRRRHDCYCETGTFGALIVGLTASLWLLGPGIVFLLLRHRRPWDADHCPYCGYLRTGAASKACSECGRARPAA